MALNIRWKDIDKSDAVIFHLENKLIKLDEFLCDNEQKKIEFVHYSKKNTFKTRMNLILKTKKMIRVEAESNNILTSINDAINKALDQIRKDKTKHEK